MLTAPKVSACIVLYRSGEAALDAARCVASSTIPVELHVVDNSPEEPIADEICQIVPETIVHRPPRNLGYGGGNNVAIRVLRSRYHLIMNPDVVFAPDLIERMVAFMDAHPDIAILTPRVYGEDGEEQFLPRLQPTVRYLLGGVLEGRSALARRWRDEYTLRGQTIEEPMSVQFATGCFMLARTKLLYRLEGFDERFFLYHEDSDLSRRALRLGQIVYHPDMCVTHLWKRSSHTDRRARGEHIRSTLRFFRKWGWRW